MTNSDIYKIVAELRAEISELEKTANANAGVSHEISDRDNPTPF